MTFNIKELLLAILATFVVTMTCAYGCARRAVTQGEAAAAQAEVEAKKHEAEASKLATKVAQDAQAVQKSQTQAYAAGAKVVAARRKVNQGMVAVPQVMPVAVPELQALVAKQEIELENYKSLTDTQEAENAALKQTIAAQAKQILDLQAENDQTRKAYLAQQTVSEEYHKAMKAASFKSGFKGFLFGAAAAEVANLASKRK